MLESLKVKYLQTIESVQEGGLKNIFKAHPQVYRNRTATPVVMDLSSPNITPPSPPPNTSFHFTEIKLEDLQAGKWTYALPSRAIKSRLNFQAGLRSVAVTEASTVVGDLWCYPLPESGKLVSHPDLNVLSILGITLEKGDVYAFDMVIAPAYRGKSLASPLQRFLQATLKQEGYQKVYGYYWDDNVPALWMHRMLKFKELPKRRISRFFIYMKVQSGEGGGL